MKIVHLDAGLEWRGGQKQVHLLHRGLLNAGFDSYLICNKQGKLYEQSHSELTNCIGWNYSGNRSFKTKKDLKSILDHTQSDIIHYHDSLSLNYSSIGDSYKIETRRVSYPIKWLSRKTKYKKINHHVGVSQTITNYLKTYFNNCSTIHSSIDLDYFSNAIPLGILKNESKYNILFVGAYSNQKGVQILLYAFAQLLKEKPDSILHLCGSGDLQLSINKLIVELGIENQVVQYGHQKDIAPFYHEADVVVVPSVDGEGSSGTIKEGIASLKTVIASDIAPNKELITHDKDGFLFNSEDSNSLCELLLQQPRIASEILVERREDFSSKIMIEKYIELYQSLNL